jgi:hypothetical protein
MDRERQESRYYHDKTQQRFDEFEVARVQQDEGQRARLGDYFARKAADEAERAERNMKESMGAFSYYFIESLVHFDIV